MASPINPTFGSDQRLISQDCKTCGVHKPVSDFPRKGDGYSQYCRSCQANERAARKQGLGSTRKAQVSGPALQVNANAGDYVASREVLATWAANQLKVAAGRLPSNHLFVGPSGSGKSAAAEYLAKLSGWDFTKVDAPSMTEPDSWFGTREVVVEDGASKTIYHPSDFVLSIQRPGVTLIDEVNRVSDAVRNSILGLLDHTRSVTNPITGETVTRHPGNFLIMTGNVGVQFTGTYAIDPAFLTRSLVTRFDYLEADAETTLAVNRTGCTLEQAQLFVRFAQETRSRAKQDEDFPPISTREVLEALELVAVGLDETTAARQAIINAASQEGGAESVAANLEMIWTGIRPK